VGGEPRGRYLCHAARVGREEERHHGTFAHGKPAVMAAAFDERIAAVIASGGNTGEANPWRYTSDPLANVTMERIIEVIRTGFRCVLRFFIGRENKLPVDQNSMFA